MRQVYKGIYVSSEKYCFSGNSEWAVVHASNCKKMKNFITLQEGSNLFLNMEDRETPHFVRSVFKEFLAFTYNYWSLSYRILIHCYRGESRSPSLALLFLAKGLEIITSDSYEEAKFEYELIDPGYLPGRGIKNYLKNNWDYIFIE